MEDLSVDPATKAKLVVAEQKKAAPGTKAPMPIADQTPPLRPLPKLEKAKIAFFLDGVCQGVAFEDLYDFLPLRMHPGGRERRERKKADPRTNWHDDGTMGYYPLVSVFGGGIATINPGPLFDFPPPEDIEAALRESPHPSSSAPLYDIKGKQAEGSVDDKDTTSDTVTWRPLCERYPEFLAEQNRLDDLDEQEAVRVFAENAMHIAEAGGIDPDTRPSAAKKGKVVENGKLEELGVVKKEEVVSVGSPAMSPRPTSVQTHQWFDDAVTRVDAEDEAMAVDAKIE
jgi:COMPASS component BRE2